LASWFAGLVTVSELSTLYLTAYMLKHGDKKMPKHLQREIENLKKKLLNLSAIVEERVLLAVRSVEKKDEALARRIMDEDETIDKMEIEVEEDCLKVLALHQPVAVDLRFIIAVLKINNDLERIGDLAVNIAERSVVLAGRREFEFTSNFLVMCEKSILMLKKCLDSFIGMDAKRALEVCASDDEIDELYREMFYKIKTGISTDIEKVDEYLQVLSISRHIERIADHATNIAEDVIYMIEGDIIRHRTEDFRKVNIPFHEKGPDTL
jgi:phosphate transport system protein